MAEQTENAFLKQPKVFLCSKKSGKGKRPRKGGNRFWKSIGLGFKTPREAIEGNFYLFAMLSAFTRLLVYVNSF
uniref:Putative ribosomal protein S17/S11, 40S ribosomal protein S11 n=1 Tax=Helianthus annuus TaxID=4232 RepID=A0A251SDU0_HELAN